MGTTGFLDRRFLSAEQCLDVVEVLVNCDLVSLSFIVLLPLVVIVKNQRDDVVETVDEAIGRSPRHESMKLAVELREVVIAPIDVVQQLQMCVPEHFELRPQRRRLGQFAKRGC